MLRRLGIVGLMMVGLSGLVTPAVACENYSPAWSIDYMLNWSEYYVKGVITESDDAGQNFTLRIENSLKGVPPPNVLIFNTNPLIPRSYVEHSYYNGCTYLGDAYFAVGQSGYFPIRRHPNGYYETLLTRVEYSSFTIETKATLKTDPNYQEDGWGLLASDANNHFDFVPTPTEDDFIKLVQDRGGNLPILPKDELVYPLLYAPIYIETDANERYIVPIDGGNLIPAPENVLLEQTKLGVVNLERYSQSEELCAEDRCLNFSPDMSLFTVQKSSNHLLMDFPSNWDMPTSELAGQYSIFAPTNDGLAVWNEGVVDVYKVKWDYYPKPEKIASLTLSISQAATRELIEQSIQWSENGNILAYADDEGVWWFDLYHESEPKLVIEAESDNIPRIVQVSSDGRFIAYSLDGSLNQWELRDMNTGATYANRLITPNGRNSIQINSSTVADEISLPTTFQNVRPYTLKSGENWEIEWIGSDGYIITFCDNQKQICHGDYCDPGSFDNVIGSQDRFSCFSFPKSYFSDAATSQADYAHQLGVVMSGDNILQAIRHNHIYWYHKLSLKGNITHVEWMLPLFYYGD